MNVAITVVVVAVVVVVVDMLIGLVCIAVGFILMAGGGSDNPEVFNEEIYSWRRIRLAPTLVIIGFAIEIYAILVNPKK